MADVFSGLGFKPSSALKQQALGIRKSLHAGRLSKGKRNYYHAKLQKIRAKANPVDSSGMPLATLDAAARAQTRDKYGTDIQTIDQQVAGYKQRIADTPVWFDQYRTHLATLATDQTTAAAAQAQDYLNATTAAPQPTAAMSQAIADQNPQAQQGIQAAQTAAQGRQQLAQGQAAAIKERGAIRGNLYNTFAADSLLAQQRQQGLTQGALNQAQTTKSNLLGAINDYFINAKSDIRNSALDAQLKQIASQLAGSKAKVDASYKAGQLDIGQTRAGIAQQQADIAQQRADWAASPDNPKNQSKTPKTGYSQAQRVSFKTTANKALSDYESNIVTHPGKGNYKGQSVRYLRYNTAATGALPSYQYVALTGRNRQEVLNRTTSRIGDRTIAAGVTDQLIYGHVNRQVWDAIRRLGINPNGLGLRLKK